MYSSPARLAKFITELFWDPTAHQSALKAVLLQDNPKLIHKVSGFRLFAAKP